MAKEYKTFAIDNKAIEGREVPGIAAVFGNVDSSGDRIFKGAFSKTLKEGASRVKHLWMHNPYEPPTAVIRDLREIGKRELPEAIKESYPDATGGLFVVREYLDTPRGNEVFEGIKAGAITEMSFGYDSVKFDFENLETDEGKMQVRNLREVRLWDTSDVIWGMNQATMAVKMAVPYRDTGTSEDDWEAPTLGDFTSEAWGELDNEEKIRIMNHYAFSMERPPETFGSLKLPHHKPSRSGVGPAVWRGVAAAMAALLGARGGVDIPDRDRRSVYEHLAKHYRQFEKEPPNFKLIELAANAQEVLLLGEDIAGLKQVMDALKEFAAEPPEVAPLALTQHLARRLAIAERLEIEI